MICRCFYIHSSCTVHRIKCSELVLYANFRRKRLNGEYLNQSCKSRKNKSECILPKVAFYCRPHRCTHILLDHSCNVFNLHTQQIHDLETTFNCFCIWRAATVRLKISKFARSSLHSVLNYLSMFSFKMRSCNRTWLNVVKSLETAGALTINNIDDTWHSMLMM